MTASKKSTSANKPTKMPAARSGQLNAPVAATTSTPKNPVTVTASDAPIFREWKIEKLADISTVDKDQMDKCLYFLSQVIRKCRILNRVLLSMTYHEQGRIRIEMQDMTTGEIFIEPKPDPVVETPATEDDEDPLA